MADREPNFTPNQIEAINQQITTALVGLTSKIETITARLINTNQDQIVKNAELRITDAINKNQRVIIASEPDAPKKGEDKEGNGWKMFMVALPIIMTAALGFWTWTLQKDIETKISESSELLKTELALKEEFYKQKLKTYEENHKQMYQLVESLQNAQVDPESRSKAIENLRTMYQNYSSHSLYMSNEVIKELQKLWSLGTDLPAIRKNGKADMDQIIEQISQVEKVMREDLHVNEIGQFSKILKRN